MSFFPLTNLLNMNPQIKKRRKKKRITIIIIYCANQTFSHDIFISKRNHRFENASRRAGDEYDRGSESSSMIRALGNKKKSLESGARSREIAEYALMKTMMQEN